MKGEKGDNSYDSKKAINKHHSHTQTKTSRKPFMNSERLLGLVLAGSSSNSFSNHLGLLSTLGLGALLLAFLGSNAALTKSFGLIRSKLETGHFGLGLVDVLHENTLVLENVTLDLHVQRMVHVTVNLSRITQVAQHAAENAHATDPDQLGGHASLASTATLTNTAVTALALGFNHETNTETRVHLLRLLDQQSVVNELAHCLTAGGVLDFRGLVWVHPDLALSSLHDAGSQTALQTKSSPIVLAYSVITNQTMPPSTIPIDAQ